MTPQSEDLRPPLGNQHFNVATRLLRHCELRPNAIALREPRSRRGLRHDVETTFTELTVSVAQYVVGLERLGVSRGMRVVLMVPPSRELIRLVYALLQLGAVMVLVDPGIGIRNLGKCLNESQPEAFFGIRKAQLARRLFGWARSTIRISATISQRRRRHNGLAEFDTQSNGSLLRSPAR